MRPVALLLFVLVGCDNSAEERVKLAEQQKQVEKKIAKAEQQGRDGIAEAQKQIEQLKTELGEAKSRLEEATKAQVGSPEARKQVEAAVAKARKAYKALATDEFGELAKDSKELSTKLAKAPAKTKVAATKSLQQVSEKQKAVAASLKEFDSATLETLDTVKAKVDKELAALRASIKAGRAKLP